MVAPNKLQIAYYDINPATSGRDDLGYAVRWAVRRKVHLSSTHHGRKLRDSFICVDPTFWQLCYYYRYASPRQLEWLPCGGVAMVENALISCYGGVPRIALVGFRYYYTLCYLGLSHSAFVNGIEYDYGQVRSMGYGVWSMEYIATRCPCRQNRGILTPDQYLLVCRGTCPRKHFAFRPLGLISNSHSRPHKQPRRQQIPSQALFDESMSPNGSRSNRVPHPPRTMDLTGHKSRASAAGRPQILRFGSPPVKRPASALSEKVSREVRVCGGCCLNAGMLQLTLCQDSSRPSAASESNQRAFVIGRAPWPWSRIRVA